MKMGGLTCNFIQGSYHQHTGSILLHLFPHITDFILPAASCGGEKEGVSVRQNSITTPLSPRLPPSPFFLSPLPPPPHQSTSEVISGGGYTVERVGCCPTPHPPDSQTLLPTLARCSPEPAGGEGGRTPTLSVSFPSGPNSHLVSFYLFTIIQGVGSLGTRSTNGVHYPLFIPTST